MDIKKSIDDFGENGFSVLTSVLDADEVRAARSALEHVVQKSESYALPPGIKSIDPNANNIRIYDLIEHSPAFIDLAFNPTVMAAVKALLGQHIVMSNFTANIALPGSGSMKLHCDQSTVMPEPWSERFALTVIWCLDDVDESNGATRYVPGSHRFTRFDQVSVGVEKDSVAFAAPAGSAIIMDGRLWHTSGANRSEDRQRACLFAFYTCSFLRLQNNWWQALSPETLEQLSPPQQRWLGLASGNIEYGGYLTE